MPKQPLVSIVLCTYNGEAFLPAQLDTLLQQTYPELEFIIADDSSTDGTYDLLQQYASKDSRIRLYKNAQNLGFNKNFEGAINKAEGEWCAFSDQDDIWALDKIEKMMKHAAGNAMVHCSSNMFQSGKTISSKLKSNYRKFEGTDVRKNFLFNTFEGHCLLMRKHIALQSMPFPEGVYYDWWLGMNASASGGVYWVKEVLTFRRLHENNASTAITKKELEEKSRLQQVVKNITAFLTIPTLTFGAKEWGTELHQKIVQHIEGNSNPLLQFLWKYRDVIFYYKANKVFPFLSYGKAINKFMRK